MNEGYEQLRLQMLAQGLFRRTYGYYAIYGFLLMSCTALSLYVITLTSSPFVQFFNAILLGVCFVQAGMLGHDLSHNEVFSSHRLNKFFAVLVWGLFAAASEGKWYEKHNDHHKHVNRVNHDPDLDIPFLFSEKQLADRSQFFKRYILPYQHVLFFCFLPLVYLGIHRESLKYISRHPSPRSIAEFALFAIHFTVLLYLLFAYLPVSVAIMFFVVHALVGGLYMGLAFAPNHKGEEITDESTPVTWVNQITSTRDLYPTWFVFHAMGGLNFQIEHHLFPTMPRMHYFKANILVKDFCSRNNIPFHETSMWGSMKEIYTALKRESTVLQ